LSNVWSWIMASPSSRNKTGASCHSFRFNVSVQTHVAEAKI
jgi:hypothetical protein